MTNWLKDAIFYEIYPQSFYDTNGDGIGDLQGIIEKLPYVRSLGANALWINPIYDSPFKDAGYDVRDYKKVASRYGTNEDAKRLFEEAHKLNIHVLLDLVPGHTSEEHAWFKESQKASENEFTNRYIWSTDVFGGMAGRPYIAGESERDAIYMLNFFKCQPALNYGFLKPEKDWQLPASHADCVATKEAMIDVMKFWLSMGCDGFRVDMADSLIKCDDDNKSGTVALWKEMLETVRKDFPEAAFVSEWSNPYQALKAGFDMDFYLNHYGNGYHTLLRDHETEGGDHSFFSADHGGSILRFLDDYYPKYQDTKDLGYISFITGNHDTPRVSRTHSTEELKLAYALLFTLPGVPFMYYGDEIGMRYLDLPTKEGGYSRTGSRSPMQWDISQKNAGFSLAEPEQIYLPIDDAKDAPDVVSQDFLFGKSLATPLLPEEFTKEALCGYNNVSDSLLDTVRQICFLRHAYEDLQADGSFAPVYARDKGLPFIYKRGDLLLIINPSHQAHEAVLTEDLSDAKVLYSISGAPEIHENRITAPAMSFSILQ